ncbi:uroporphyrinogen-III C-methyltransferase [Caldimonas tepidiphila]|uniref:uroporphyrinogen-III C-methyltransferase n=1 Tax=Caldimonas tepidiphila TaxID=2315841 RepID=UPI000E5BCA65|nr:uroporphyrinogen-III C-methyltransferase [Caldimonas tepidiphila]
MAAPSPAAPTGRVVFVGAGPGSADLITLRGLRALQQAEVVLFDALADPALRDYAPGAEWIDVGKRGFSHRPGSDASGQPRINALIVEHALRGKRVVRLKGGDPSIFGRLEEELQAAYAAGLECEVVPGVTAALAAAAGTRLPLTRRGTGRSVTLTTAMTRAGSLQPGEALAARRDTEVLYMAGKQLAALAEQLLDAGWPSDTPCSVVSRAGWADQLHTAHCIDSLHEAGEAHAGRPTVVVVGAGARPVPAADEISPPSQLTPVNVQ